MQNLHEIRELLASAESIVFLGGAGVSTDSGIPEFRGNGGIYTGTDDYEEAPETILSAQYLFSKPETFYEFYRTHMVFPYAEPNDAHYALARLEQGGKLSAIITQNIDGLHQAAGSQNVFEIHGAASRNYCVRCGKTYTLKHILEANGVPYCHECDGIIRPDVVLYGESLDTETLSRAEEAIYDADVLIVGGTSLAVYSAASLVEAFEGEHLIIINNSPTPFDECAEYVLRGSISEILNDLIE